LAERSQRGVSFEESDEIQAATWMSPSWELPLIALMCASEYQTIVGSALWVSRSRHDLGLSPGLHGLPTGGRRVKFNLSAPSSRALHLAFRV